MTPTLALHRLTLVAVLLFAIASCSSGSPASSKGSGGVTNIGGKFGVGGAVGMGGITAAGGLGGISGTGGMPPTGGTTAANGGTAIGGTTSIGGASAIGGSGATGGSGTGGAPALAPVPTAITFRATAISDDGSVVIGRDPSNFEMGFRWTATTGSTVLGAFWPRAISADGMTIAVEGLNGHRVIRITGATLAATPLPFPRQNDNESQFVAMSRDGTTIAGNAWREVPLPTTSQAFRWTITGGVQALDFLPGDDASEALAMSPDGSIIVGLSYKVGTAKGRPFLWRKDTGTVPLTVLPTSTLTVPIAVNDAAVVVGEAFGGGTPSFGTISSPTSRDPIVWTDGAPRVVGGCGAIQSTMNAVTATGTILGACGHSRLFLVSAVEAAVPRYLTLPPPPDGYTEDQQFVTPVGMSADAATVIGRRDLGSLGRPGSSILVWSDGASVPAILPPKWTAISGEELEYPVVTAMSANVTTIAGVASDDNRGWVLRLR